MLIQSLMVIKIKIFVITRFNNITSLNNYDRYYLPIIIIHLNVN